MDLELQPHQAQSRFSATESKRSLTNFSKNLVRRRRRCASFAFVCALGSCTAAYTLYFVYPMKLSIRPFVRGTSSIRCSDTCLLRHACIPSNGTVTVYGEDADRLRGMIASFQLRSNREGVLLVNAVNAHNKFSGVWRRSAILVDRYVETNCGHILGDEVWPIFRIMLQRRHALALWDKWDIYIDRAKEARCDSYFTPLTDGEVLTYKNSLARNKETRCYENIYFGTSGLSYVDDDVKYLSSTRFSEEARLFRDMYFRAFRAERYKPSKILIMQKKTGEHLVAIENLEELKLAAAAEFKDNEVQTASWSDYTIAEQITLMARTKVFISLPGSDVMNAIFLPDNSILVVYCRYYNDQIEGSNEIRLWYRFFRHIQVFEFCEANTDVSPRSPGQVWVNVSRLSDLRSRLAENYVKLVQGQADKEMKSTIKVSFM